MAIIAVAGGTGDLGRTFVECLVEVKKHKVLVLGRKAPASPVADTAEFVAVNYDDIDGLAKTLEAKHVDTVIATIPMEGHGPKAQLNLIAAADKASTVKRFMPSDYAAYTPDMDQSHEYPAAVESAARALRKTSLSYSHVLIGFFMDYFGQPNVRSHLKAFRWGVDPETRRAAIPGTGDDLISMTYSYDVGRVVTRLMDEDKWDEYSFVSGQDITLNQVVKLFESVGFKLQVSHENIEDLEAGKTTDFTQEGAPIVGGESMSIYALMGSSTIKGQQLLPKEPRLNSRFPELKLKTVAELITEAWASKIHD